MSDSCIHPLLAWLKANGISNSAFAAQLRISAPHLSMILARRKGASLAVAVDCEILTGGAIKPSHLDNRPVSARAAQAPDRGDPPGADAAAAGGSIHVPAACPVCQAVNV